jgi:hypothetical protein
VTDPLDVELDRLFRLPPAQLVGARNALADQRRRAGDKAGAARVKAIKRAAPAAWAFNQVYFDAPELLQLAREHAEQLRALQTQRGVDSAQLAAAVEQQKSSTQAIVDAALRAGRQAGLSETALPQRKVFTTVQGWLAGKGEEPPGRMTQEIEASGFDAFAGMTLTNAPPVVKVQPKPAANEATAVPAAAPDRAALERATQLIEERDQLATAARERVRVRGAEQTTARQLRDSAQAAVREAERRAAELRTTLDQRELELQTSSAALEEARREQQRAEEAVAEARKELTGVSGAEG